MSSIRRAATALVTVGLAAVLAITLAVPSPSYAVSSTSPAGHGGTWLSHQLTHGLIHNDEFDFDDYGLSVDTAFALKAIGGHPTTVAHIRGAMSHHVDDYTTDAAFGLTDVFAGAIAKLLVFAQATGGGARDFGGSDLVQALDERVVATGAARGRIQDVVDPTSPGDSANAIGQIFAVRGLLTAHDPLARPALRYLLLQQCPQGWYRLKLGKVSSDNQACTATSAPDNDVTSLAVVELWRFRQGHPALRTSLREAVQWLKAKQGRNGAFGGGPSTAAPNSNSTGLAAWALGTSGRCLAAARSASWIQKLQVGGHLKGTPLEGQRGAVAYDAALLRAGTRHGITTKTQDSWRRATAQAAPGLIYLRGRHCG
jgi:hypothetical protein